MTTPECSVSSRQAAEPLAATAPAKHGSWLLIEHPGPWPAQAPWRLLPPVAAKVCAAAKDRGIQVSLIRRHRDRRVPPPHLVYLASRHGQPPWLRAAELADLDDLAYLDLDALAAGSAPGLGTPVDGRLLLVCTHGQRDRCCARYGRPVAAALATRYPDLVWETGHVGGHRFAANVVCLPALTFHGRVDPASAAAVGAACLAGEVVLPHYRGRAGLPTPVQAAEHAARLRFAEHRAEAVTPLEVTADHASGTAQVRLAVAGVEYTATVRQLPDRPLWTSCTDTEATMTPHYDADFGADLGAATP
jgi:hypothetical protein